ncbi:MAG: discoidin domain-containing protein, partial [Phycisphaerae bacterium]
PLMPLTEMPQLSCDEPADRIVISGRDFELIFSKTTGTIAALVYEGQALIRDEEGRVNGPILNAFRAPVNNDKYCSGGWRQAGLDALRREVRYVTVDKDNPRAVTIETLVESHGKNDCRFDLYTTWSVLGNGCINVSSRIVPHAAPNILPRIGLRMALPAEHDTFTWFGRGPHENYADRKTGADVGLYHSSVAEQFVPYVDTQETGNKEDVRWAALTDDGGAGLLVVAGSQICVTALHYTAQELAAARHPVELPERDEVILCLDYAQNGLGGASCGPPPMDKYLLRPQPIVFTFSLRPYVPATGPLPEVARRQVPIAPRVGIRRDEAGLVTLACEHERARIQYSTDGSDPRANGRLYTEPFDFADGGTVRAVALGEGLIPSPISSETYGLLIPRSEVKVIYADSEHPGEGEAYKAIDGRPDTYWHSKWGRGEPKHPHELRIDLGGQYELTGFTYLPRQDSRNGRIADYELYLSADGKNWSLPASTGRFPNTAERQTVMFDRPIAARFIRLVARSEVAGHAWTSVAELDVIAAKRFK